MSEHETTWTVVVPTKRSEAAKSRLAPALGPWRARLARAFAVDTITAVRSCPLVGRIIVVQDSVGLDTDIGALGIETVADPSHGGDMNAAITAGVGAARAGGDGPVAVLTADLPALRPAELEAALRMAAREPLSATSDTEGSGTTMLASTRVELLVPRFGHDSFARHVDDGAKPLTAGPGLARDIDLPEHLEQAAALGVGASTAAVLDAAGLP